MNQEAIEYRIKRNRQNADQIGATLLWAIGFVAAAVGAGLELPGVMAAGLVITGISLAAASLSIAAGARGYNRAFWSNWHEFSDPPLNEWEEPLEDEGAFTTADWTAADAAGGESA